MKKKLFCILGLILIASAIAYFAASAACFRLAPKMRIISFLKFTRRMSRIIW